MSTVSIAVQGDAGRLPRRLISAGNASKRLLECARILRAQVKKLQGDDSPVATWLLENHSYLQFQIRETRRALPPAYLRTLPKIGEGASAGLRVYGLAADLLAKSDDAIDADGVAECALALTQDESLVMGELWAFGAALRLVLIERLCANLDSERTVALTIGSLRAIEKVDWRNFAESISIVERTLERDPAGVYGRMDFATRDAYRHKVEWIARQAKLPEREVAEKAIAAAAEAEGERAGHVGYYLIGDGALAFRQELGCRRTLGERARGTFERWPSFFYISGIVLATSLVVAGMEWLAGAYAIWISLLLLIPASQAAIEIVNTLVNRALAPRSLPSMDFSDGIPDDSKTMVVVPTLLLSSGNAGRLLEDLEIRYLANRGSNLYFALLTDFPDADTKETPNDSVLAECVEGIKRLNARYGSGAEGPFYLFHRPRLWNEAESKWMGYERKRGKLNDLNRLLLKRGNAFSAVVGNASRLAQIRYVITLDTDTQLPLDTAAKMVAAAAHPLNRPVLDAETGMVTDGYALIRPRVAVSMESAGRSRLAHIYSGQTGFDPYATAVSDVYQDLYGQASFTGKGIYDVRAFEAAAGRDRFPENTILSHDLIEGEYARTGLLTSVELVEDFPATYEGFSKRNHRWVRGDWQLLSWLGHKVPAAGGAQVENPLPFLSRWKMFDNLRRSLFEICVLLLFAAGWLAVEDTLRWTAAILALLLIAAYADVALTIVSAPERRFWRAFVQNLGERVAESHRNALLSLIFIPHQACMLADAISRTLSRRFVTKRKLLEWETMAQSEAGGAGNAIGRYFYLSCGFAVLLFMLLLAEERWNVLAGLVCMSWIAAPLAARWLNRPLPEPAGPSESDREFLRGTALRTWRFFADHADAEHHWLAPDNVQQAPSLAAHRVSPTNLGLLLNAHQAAFDFGYVNIEELQISLRRLFDTIDKMPLHRGHFFNWYDTRTLAPEGRRFISSVDSGNLAAAFCAVRQGCLESLRQPVFGRTMLDGLRDHTLRVREELPYGVRSGALMRLLASLLRQFESEPSDLFHFGAVLRDCRDTLQRSRASFARAHARLEDQGDSARSDELRYWEELLFQRMDAALEELYRLAPWLSPTIEPELRLNIRNATLTPLLADLSSLATLGELPEVYERLRTRLLDRLNSKDRLYPDLRLALEDLLGRLPESRVCAERLIGELENIAEHASWMFDQMDFRFLFDAKRKLLRVGYDVDSGEAEESCYDLLASEARTAVFLAIAKGDIPREAWFRLGRKLTAYRNRRTLVSWSGTMFEYLMPLLHMRSYGNTLLDSGARGAIAIQQLYSKERGLPWGISEAAYSVRDEAMQYQYQAFGVPPMSASPQRGDRVVVAPYASMLALMLDPAEAAANLQLLAAKGCLARHGFFESIEYSASNDGVELIRTFMAHHQAMGLLAIDNALLGGRIQERFHSDPRVQATEFLLQERMPALVETLGESEHAAA